MPAPNSAAEFLTVLAKSQLVAADRVEACLRDQRTQPTTAREAADRMIDAGLVTRFQAEQLLKGKYRGFSIGKYRVLDKLGAGGMGQVFLCEHPHLRRRAAVKVLPNDRASDPALVGR